MPLICINQDTQSKPVHGTMKQVTLDFFVPRPSPKGEAGDFVLSSVHMYIHMSVHLCIRMYAPNNTISIFFLCIALKLTGIIYLYTWTPGVFFFSMIQIPRWPPDGHLPQGVKFHSHIVYPFPFGYFTQNLQGLSTSKQGTASLTLSLIRYLIWPPGCHLVFSLV